MRRRRRSLVSPSEVVAELSDAVRDSASMVCRATAWGEVQLVEMQFPARGCVIVPPIGFYSISSHTGTQSYLCEDRGSRTKPERVPPGATLLHEVGKGARYAWAAPHHAHMTCLDPQVVQRAAEETGWVRPSQLQIPSAFDRRDDVLEHLVSVLAAEAQLGTHAVRPLMVESVVTALACRLLERVATPKASSKCAPGALPTAAFEHVRAYIEDNLGQNISLEALAGVAGVSRFHFARQFRLRTGESPLGYVRRLRIERAKRLLRSSRIRIADVALELGFADQSHFSRTFQRFVGLSPVSFTRLYVRTISGAGSRPERVPRAARTSRKPTS